MIYQTLSGHDNFFPLVILLHIQKKHSFFFYKYPNRLLDGFIISSLQSTDTVKAFSFNAGDKYTAFRFQWNGYVRVKIRVKQELVLFYLLWRQMHTEGYIVLWRFSSDEDYRL